jgi:hypothetical protein
MQKSSSVGFSPLFALFLVFLVLKLTDVIDWSWWWVTCPVWAVPVILILIVVGLGVAVGIGELIVGLVSQCRK